MTHTTFTRRSILSMAGGVAACALQAPARAAGPGLDEIVAGAKREGRLVVCASSPASSASHQILIDGFNKRFGLNLRIDWLAINAVTANTRVIAEAPSNRVSIDVIGAAAIDEVYALSSQGLVKSYDWVSAFKGAIPEIDARVSDVIPDMRGMALPFFDTVYCIAWNTELMKAADVPENIAQLVDPVWREKLGWNAFNLTPVDFLSYVWGPEKTLEFARKIVANKPVLENGTPAVSRSISAGTVPLGVTSSVTAQRGVRGGQPIQFKMFADFMPVSTLHLYVPEGAPNPNAARLFAAWLSSEGTALLADVDPLPRVGNPIYPDTKAIEARVKAGGQVVKPRSIADLEATAVLRRSLAQLITAARN